MAEIHGEALRESASRLVSLPVDEFVGGLEQVLGALLPSFSVASASIVDEDGMETPVIDIVVSTSPVDGGSVGANSAACAIYVCHSLDEAKLREAYERLAAAKRLRKSRSADAPRSTVTLGLVIAATSNLSLEKIAGGMRILNDSVPDDHRPDMVAVLSRGTVNYLVTFGPDQTTPGDWLPPSLEPRAFVAPVLVHMVTCATTAYPLNRVLGYLIGHLAFFAPAVPRPDARVINVGAPAHRDIVTRYQYNLSGKLTEIHEPQPVHAPPYIIESPDGELLGRLHYQPWQDGGVVILDGSLPLEGLLVFASKPLPLVCTKLRDNRQISSVLPLSFDDFTATADAIAKRSNLKVKPQAEQFTFAHIGDEGTSSPFVARLQLTPLHLRDRVLQSKEQIERFDEVYASVVNDLVTLRRIGKETIELWSVHAEKVAKGEIVRYDNAIRVDETIDERLSHNLETIIRNAASAAKQFQNLTKVFGVDIGFMFMEEKGFLDGLSRLATVDSMLADYLRETRKWLEPLMKMRNTLEHETYVAPRLRYILTAGKQIEIQEPLVFGLPVMHFVPIILSRLNRFIEEVLITASKKR